MLALQQRVQAGTGDAQSGRGVEKGVGISQRPPLEAWAGIIWLTQRGGRSQTKQENYIPTVLSVFTLASVGLRDYDQSMIGR